MSLTTRFTTMRTTSPALVQVERLLEKHYLHIVGGFYIIAQLIILTALFPQPETRYLLFWICNNFCFFLAFACFRNNMQLVKGIGYVGLLPQLLWISDFLSQTMGFRLSGTTDYINIEGFTYANQVSIALHLFIPISILAISFRERPLPRSLLYSVQYIFMIYLATYAGTPAIADVNCVFMGCSPTGKLPYSVVVWPLYISILTLASYGVHMGIYTVWHRHGRRFPEKKLSA